MREENLITFKQTYEVIDTIASPRLQKQVIIDYLTWLDEHERYREAESVVALNSYIADLEDTLERYSPKTKGGDNNGSKN